MIKIEVDDIASVKEEFFIGVELLIKHRIDFYLKVFRVIDKQTGYDIATIINCSEFDTRTKTSFIKLLGRNASTIKRKKDFNKLRNKTCLSVHFYTYRAEYINILTELIDKATLKALLLADVDALTNQGTLYTRPWFNDESKELINKIICYDVFIKKETSPYNAYDLACRLKVNVCPYCNRIYTNTIIGKNEELIIRPTFDHFFNQAEHPFLGLSFYNLIPSCNYCNSNLKGQAIFNLNNNIHPYKEGFGIDATFDYFQVALYPDKSDPRNFRVLINENIAEINPKYLRIFGDDTIQDSGNVEIFKLREVYQGHADIIGELFVKTDKFSHYYAESIYKRMASFMSSKKEFYRYYFGNYYEEKDFNKRPMAKLTKDIISKYLPEIL